MLRLLRLLLAAAAVYCAVAALLYWWQDRLIFMRQPLMREPSAPDGWSIEPIEHRTRDAVTLRGWLVKPAAANPLPLVVYYGGNAEEVSYLAQSAGHFAGAALLLMNYRGYGRSEGRPSEAAMVSDAIELFDRMLKRADVDPARVILHGRSLGTGVAVQVARERAVRALILTSPYDSLVSVAAEHYPIFPVRWLLKHRFDSLLRAPQIRTPMLALAAAADTVIPARHARRLVDAWGGPKTLYSFDAGHNDISDTPDYWDTITTFARSHLAP